MAGNTINSGNFSGLYGNPTGITQSSSNYSNANVINLLPVYSGDMGAIGNITASGNVVASSIVGNVFMWANGTPLVQPQAYGNADVAAYLPNNMANIKAGNLSVIGVATAATVKTDNYQFANGTPISFAGNYSNTNVAAYLASASATGNINGGNLDIVNNIEANTVVAVTSVTTPRANISTVQANTANVLGNLNASVHRSYDAFTGIDLIPANGVTNIQGSLLTGNIFANSINFANGAPFAQYSNANVANYLPVYSGNISAGNVGVFSNVTANILQTTGINGDITGANNITGNAMFAFGNIRANGFFLGNGSQLTGITAQVSGNMTGNINANGFTVNNLTQLSVGGNVQATNFIGNGSQLTNVPALMTGQLAGNLTANGFFINNLTALTVAGNVTAVNFVGNGRQLTGVFAAMGGNLQSNLIGNGFAIKSDNYQYANGTPIPIGGNYSNANVASYLASVDATGNINAGNLEVVNNVDAKTVTVVETVTSPLANINVINTDDITVLSDLNASIHRSYDQFTGIDLIPGNSRVTVQGNLATQYIYGNGAFLTGIAANGAGLVLAGNMVGNITANTFYINDLPELSVSGNIISNTYFIGNGAYLTGISGSGGVANISGNLAGNLLANGFFLNDLTELSVNGNIIGNNIRTVGTSGNISGVDVLTANTINVGDVSASGNILANNLSTFIGTSTVGNVTVSLFGNIEGGYLFGNGAYLTGLPDTYANANVVAYGEAGWAGNLIPSITGTGNVSDYSLGNATNQWKSMYVSGNTIYINNLPIAVSSSTLSFDGNPVATTTPSGNLTVTNLITTGNVVAGNVSVAGAISGNISVTGNVSADDLSGNTVSASGNIISNAFVFANTVSVTGSLESNNISTINSSATGNAFGNAITGNTLSILGNITSNASIFATDVSVTGNLIGNIIGNITADNITGNSVSVSGNIQGNNVITIDLSASGNIQSNSVVTIDLSASGNIQSNSVVTIDLSATGNVFGNVMTGNSLSILGNITSNASVFAADLSVSGAVTSNSVSSIDYSASGNIVADGNISANNISASNVITAGSITATGNITAQYYYGDGSKLTGIAPTVQVYQFSNTLTTDSLYQATWLSDFVPGNVVAITTPASTTPAVIGSFLTQEGYPGITTIPVGAISVTFETQKDSGNQSYYCYAEIYKRDPAGTETLLLTSDNTSALAVNTVVQQSVIAYVATPITLALTDRIFVRIYAVMNSGTSDITFTFDGTTSAGLQLPALPASATQFVPYTGATSNVNLGVYNLSTTGNLQGANLSTFYGTTTVGNVTTSLYGNIYGNAFSAALVANTVTGNIPTLSATGNLVDSGKTFNDAAITNSNYWSAAQTSSYVINQLLNVPSLPAVNLATTANVAKAGLTAIDGVTPTTASYILVKNQTDGDNGVYLANTGPWIRQAYIGNAYANVTTETTYGNLNTNGGVVNVLAGTVNKNLQFQITDQNPEATFGNAIVYVTSTTKIPPAGPNNRFVDATIGNDTNNNGSSSFPFATVTRALTGAQYPLTITVAASGGTDSSAISWASGNQNALVQSQYSANDGGVTTLTGVQTFATGSTRNDFKGTVHSTGASSPFVFESGALCRNYFEDLTVITTASSWLTLNANVSNWISLDNISINNYNPIVLPTFANAFTINIINQQYIMPISGAGNASTVINVQNCVEGMVRVGAGFLGTLYNNAAGFSGALGSPAFLTGVITTSAELTTITNWITDTTYDGYYYVASGGSNGTFKSGSIIGKQTVAGLATSMWYARTPGQIPGALKNILGTTYTTGALTTFTGLTTVGNVTTSVFGNVTGGYFIGNGSLLTGIDAAATSNSISNGTSNIIIPTANGAINFNVGNSAYGLFSANNIAIGNAAASNIVANNINTIAIGQQAGMSLQGNSTIAVGYAAGKLSQGQQSVAVGYLAAQSAQGAFAVAIGGSAGGSAQGAQSVAIGPNTGRDAQGAYSVAIGTNTGTTTQGPNAVAIGATAGYITQGDRAVAVGIEAGLSAQGANAVAIGWQSGASSQGTQAVAVGVNAGQSGQSANAVAIGTNAATIAQGSSGIAIGRIAGNIQQGTGAIALGDQAGQAQQGIYAIAQGGYSGFTGQSAYGVAIGYQTGQYLQQSNAIAIGYRAGYTAQGTNSIAIGAFAGNSAQGNNTIVLNATGNVLETPANVTSATFINPVRYSNSVTAIGNVAVYNTTTKEVNYSNTISLMGNISLGNAYTANAALAYYPLVLDSFNNIVKLPVISSLSPVLDNTITTPPVSPTLDDAYLIPATGATGDWAGKGNQIATWTGAAWSFYVPQTGDQTTVLQGTNAGNAYIYNGTTWNLTSVNTGLPLYAWALTNTYSAGTVVIYNGTLYQANGSIPANTAFVVGTTGATWTPLATTISKNGLSNVSIGSANANITMGVANVSNVVVISATNTNITGNIIATGNISGYPGGFYQGVAASYYKSFRNTTQTLAVNDYVIFNATEASFSSDIILNTTTGVFTLQPGKTYRLRGNPNYTASIITYGWYNLTTSSNIGPLTQNSGRTGDTAEAVFTPNVTTQVALQIQTACTIGFTNPNLYAWADIQVIGGQAPYTNIALKASAVVAKGVDVTLGNLKVRIPTTGNQSMQVSTVTGTIAIAGQGIIQYGGTLGASNFAGTITTTPQYLNSNNSFNGAGWTDAWNITSAANTWRVVMIVAPGATTFSLTIEQLL